jgi:thioredoxin 1
MRLYRVFQRIALTTDDELEKIKERMLARMMAAPDPGPWRDGVILELTDSSFNDAISKARLPVLIDFWAGWCAPCKMMRPIFEAMAREYSGKAYFAKIDVDENQTTARRYGVMSIPNFVVFKGGRSVDRVVGAVGRPGLEMALRKHLG